MFDKLRVGTKAKSAQKFTPVHPDPEVGRKHGISLFLYGKHSIEYRNAVAATLRKSQQQELNAEEAVEQSADLIVSCCSGWEGVTDGPDDKAVPYDAEKLRAILLDDDYRWMRLQAEQFMRTDVNFF